MIRRTGYSLALGIFALDRLSKWWLLEKFDLAEKSPVPLLPFFDLTLIWNRGISLGLFQTGSETGRYILIALTSLISLAVAAWLWRADRLHMGVALGLVLGGAIGNIWDRFQYGAVADFLHFFIGGWSFYIFNVADAAITVGVAILLWDALFLRKKSPR